MHITLKGRLKRCFRILRRSSAKKSVRPCDWIHGNPKRHPSINHSAHLKGRCHATANGSGKTNPPSPGNVPFRVGRTLRTKTLDELTGVHIRHLLWYVMRAGEEPGPTWLACIHDMLFSGCQVAMLATITWRLFQGKGCHMEQRTILEGVESHDIRIDTAYALSARVHFV